MQMFILTKNGKQGFFEIIGVVTAPSFGVAFDLADAYSKKEGGVLRRPGDQKTHTYELIEPKVLICP